MAGTVPTIVQVNYRFDMSRAEYEERALARAPALTATPGLPAHFPFPGLGKLRRTVGGVAWEPVEPGGVLFRGSVQR